MDRKLSFWYAPEGDLVGHRKVTVQAFVVVQTLVRLQYIQEQIWGITRNL